MMKKILLSIVSVLVALTTLTGCQDHLEIIFTDYYVYIQDEYGSGKSNISTEVDGEVYSYYVKVCSTPLEEDLDVYFEVEAGDGLTDGVDYKFQKKVYTVTIPKGKYSAPIRVIYYGNPVDPTKDNTITIRLTGTSAGSFTIGYPGPSAKYSTHVITKMNI